MKRLDLLVPLLALALVTGFAPTAWASDHESSEALVFVEVSPEALSGLSADPQKTLRPDPCEGARLVVRDAAGKEKVLSAGFESACEPDVSFDASKVLFAGRKAGDTPWNIYEIDVDGRNLRQITHDSGNCREPRYLSTYYVITADEPWLQILFVSDQAGELNEKGNLPATHLYSCQIDGSEVRRITFNPSSDLDPFLMWDGRILFASWQNAFSHYGRQGRMRIFDMNVDGTDMVAFTADQGLRVQQMPMVTTNGLAIFVEMDDVTTDGGGRLGSVTLRRNLRSYRSLTAPDDGLYHSPSPLPDGSVLVSWRPVEESRPYALYRFDPANSRRGLIYEKAGWNLLQARPLVPRPRPDGRSSVVNDTHPYGQFYALDVGVNDLIDPSWLTSTTARRIRVLEGLPRHRSDGPAPSADSVLPKRILGEAPISADGSFFIEVPANIPIQIQLLDDDGMALRTCGWIWVRNKEPRGCIGCHEDGELTPPNRLVDAVKKPPVRLTLSEAQRRLVDFQRDVVPIVASGCGAASCHGGDSNSLDLRPPAAGPQDPDYVRRVYALLTEGPSSGIRSGTGPWLHPGEARTSPLIWHVTGRRTSRPWDPVPVHPVRIPIGGTPLLGPNQIRALVEWIDLGAQGVPADEAAARTAAGSEISGAHE